MIAYNIFLWSGIFLAFMLVYQAIRWTFHTIKYMKDLNQKPDRFMGFMWAGLTFGMSIFALSIFCLSLSLGHILPYILQEKDQALVLEYSDNIELYSNYSEEYATAARQQIEQYQAMQSEMARTATIAQLQFFAQQEDSVGDALTNEIRRFQELIMEQELAINKAHSRIVRRPLNKWFFGINSSNQK